MRVCVIEDNDVFREMLCAALNDHGFLAVAAADGQELDQALTTHRFDAFIVDLNLPGEEGLSISARLKRAYPGCFVLMATARDRLHDRVSGYEAGADIYMVKPLHIQELVAALKGFGRRRTEQLEMLRSWYVDLGRSAVASDTGQLAHLTHTEMLLLKAMIEAPGRLLETWRWFDVLRRPADASGKRVLEVHVVNLRRKLVDLGVPHPAIQAVRNTGYRLLVDLPIR